MTSRLRYSDAQRHAGKSIQSADISVKVTSLDVEGNEYKAPTSTRPNVCFPQVDTGTNTAIDYDIYELMLHEIGHVLGLSNSGESEGTYRLVTRIIQKRHIGCPTRQSRTR